MKVWATVLDVNLDADYWEQQFKDAQIEFDPYCCARYYYYYVKVPLKDLNELPCVNPQMQWQFAGKMP